MAVEKIYPKVDESFGNLLLQKRVDDKSTGRFPDRRLTHIGYELESSEQEGSIIVYIPVKQPEIDCVKNYDEKVELINPYCVIDSNDARKGKANYEIYADQIKIGGNK